MVPRFLLPWLLCAALAAADKLTPDQVAGRVAEARRLGIPEYVMVRRLTCIYDERGAMLWQLEDRYPMSRGRWCELFKPSEDVAERYRRNGFMPEFVILIRTDVL